MVLVELKQNLLIEKNSGITSQQCFKKIELFNNW